MTRRRKNKKDVKRHQICLRLTNLQMELLDRYCDQRNFNTEVEALRSMIDGVEDWLKKREAQRSVVSSHHSSKEGPTPSGLPSASSDVDPSDVDSNEDDVDLDDVDQPSVGDFGGHPSIGLPGATAWNDGMED